MGQTYVMPTTYTMAISTTSAATELRSLMAETRAASNLGRETSAMRPRSRNCRTTGRIRWWITSSATMSRGRATRKRIWTPMSFRKGTLTPSHACPLSPDRISSGSQTTTATATSRRRRSSQRVAG